MDRKTPFSENEVIAGTPYRVVRLVGIGGMGSVYEVEHRELGKRFILKSLLSDLARREDLVSRLRTEWRALGRLDHRNIVSVSDAGMTASGVPFYVMERLLGESLYDCLRGDGPLPVGEALRIARDMLDGLSAAHAIGIVHRDVKPANVYLTEDGAVKLLDFGVAKILGRDKSLTSLGVSIGTPRYMSPEQAAGERVSGQADVYAVGIVLFEMLSGKAPFHDEDPQQLLWRQVNEPAALVSSVATQRISAELDALVAKLLEKHPLERPASARHAADCIARLQGELTMIDPTPEAVVTPSINRAARDGKLLTVPESPKAYQDRLAGKARVASDAETEDAPRESQPQGPSSRGMGTVPLSQPAVAQARRQVGPEDSVAPTRTSSSGEAPDRHSVPQETPPPVAPERTRAWAGRRTSLLAAVMAGAAVVITGWVALGGGVRTPRESRAGADTEAPNLMSERSFVAARPVAPVDDVPAVAETNKVESPVAAAVERRMPPASETPKSHEGPPTSVPSASAATVTTPAPRATARWVVPEVVKDFRGDGTPKPRESKKPRLPMSGL